MKKTLFAMAVFAISAVAQAASLNWSFNAVREASPVGNGDSITIGSYSAYLFVTANTTGVELTLADENTILGLLSAAHDGSQAWSGVCSTIKSASAANQTNTGAGAWTGATGLDGFSSGALTAFAVIFDATTIDNANNYYVVSGGETKTAGFTSAAGTKMLSFGPQATNTQLAIDASDVSWQSIGGSATTPEPATATLSLLALAGLASRRRRH